MFGTAGLDPTLNDNDPALSLCSRAGASSCSRRPPISEAVMSPRWQSRWPCCSR